MMAYATVPSRSIHVREGVTTGLLGAGVVAICYLLFDLVRGVPLLTPSVLGEVILFHRQVPSLTPELSMVAIYTVFHVAVFIAFGILVTTIAGAGRTNAIARYGLVQLLVAFVVFALGVLAFMSDATRGLFPMPVVLGANVLAAIAMGSWIWMQHPSLRWAMRTFPLGAIDQRDVTTARRP